MVHCTLDLSFDYVCYPPPPPSGPHSWAARPAPALGVDAAVEDGSRSVSIRNSPCVKLEALVPFVPLVLFVPPVSPVPCAPLFSVPLLALEAFAVEFTRRCGSFGLHGKDPAWQAPLILGVQKPSWWRPKYIWRHGFTNRSQYLIDGPHSAVAARGKLEFVLFVRLAPRCVPLLPVVACVLFTELLLLPLLLLLLLLLFDVRLLRVPFVPLVLFVPFEAEMFEAFDAFFALLELLKLVFDRFPHVPLFVVLFPARVAFNVDAFDTFTYEVFAELFWLLF